MKLALTIIQASNLPLRPNGDLPCVYITGKMCFEDCGFDMFETKVIRSLNPIYNETFVFHEVEAIDTVLLEILLWDKKQTIQINNRSTITSANDNSTDDSDKFIGVIQLPLNEANTEDQPLWYELQDRRIRKPSTSSVAYKSSSNESSESFQKMPLFLESTKHYEHTESSTHLLKQALNRSIVHKQQVESETLSIERKHFAAQIVNDLSNRENLQPVSVTSMLDSSMILSKMDNMKNNDDNINNQQQRHSSIPGAQSEKMKRRISKTFSKFFRISMRRASGLISKSSPQTPASTSSLLNATRKCSLQVLTNIDIEINNNLSMGTSTDNLPNLISKSPRHSTVSATRQDEQQALLLRPIPLQQMPIGQLMLPYVPSSRHSSLSGSSIASYYESDDDIARYFILSGQQQEQINENNNFHTHAAGPGQVTPRNYENSFNDFIHMGQIQIGLIVTKGLLEIDIVCARNLQKITDDMCRTNVQDNPPDTYVKT